MRHFHHAQKREQQQTISHVTLNISAHTPQVLLNNSPFSFMFSLLYGFAIVPPPPFFRFVQEASVLYGHLCY